MDEETTKVVSEQKDIAEFILSRPWGIIKNMLTEKVLDLQSINNVDSSSPEAAVLDIKARRAAVDILMSWFREVEGIAAQSSQSKPLENTLTDEDKITQNFESSGA